MAETAETAVKSGALSVQVVTPEGALFEGDAAFVAVPAADGEVGILVRHTPLIAKLGIGVLRVFTDAMGGVEAARFAVRGGFLQVLEDQVTLLVTDAEKPEEADEEALAKEHEEILTALSHPSSDEEYVDLQNRRRWVESRQALLS